jgi:hypothetical protein
MSKIQPSCDFGAIKPPQCMEDENNHVDESMGPFPSYNNPIVQPSLSTKCKIVYNGCKFVTIIWAFFQNS